MIILKTTKSRGGIRPANLFFIELLAVLLFFSFSSAVILKIFAAADRRQELSDLTEKAVICAQSVAEAFSVSGSLSETVNRVFAASEDYGSEAVISLSDNFMPSDEGAVSIRLVQSDEKSAAGVLSHLDIYFNLDNTEYVLYVSCASYSPYTGGAEDE